MKKTLSGLFMAIPFLTFAQTNFKPGYVVPTQGDTLKGYIDHKERNINPSGFSFKSSTNGQAQEYTLDNAIAYSINGAEAYERHEVRMSQSKEQLSDLSIGVDTTFKTDVVFLKVMQTGKNVNLYAYQDLLKKRFYILPHGETMPEELIRSKYLSRVNNSTVMVDNKYIRQLALLDSKIHSTETANPQRLKNVKYVESDLLKVVSAMNEQEVKSAGSSVRYFAGLALSGSQAKYVAEHPLAGNSANNKTSYRPMLMIGVDLFANPEVKKLVYRLELGLLSHAYDISNVNTEPGVGTTMRSYKHTFNELTAQLTPQIIYNIYNTEPFKFYVAGGLNLNLATYSKDVTTNVTLLNTGVERISVEEDAVKFENFYVSPRLSTGVVLNNKWEVAASYVFKSGITNYSFYNIEVQRISLGVNFLFGK